MAEAVAGRSRAWAFAGLAYCFFVVMLGTTLPTPLYGIYQQELGFSALVLTALFASYAVGVLAALLVWGPVSDRIGRGPGLAPGLIAAALSGVVFLLAQGLGLLFVARVLSGLSAGVFTGTATAALLDLAGEQGRRRAAVVSTAVNVGGLGCGPLLAGALAEHAPSPLQLPFWIHLALLVPGAVAVTLMPETVAHRQPLRVRVQPLRVPPVARAVFVRATIAGFAGFAVFGVFSAVIPSFLSEVIDRPNRLLAGAVVFTAFASAAAGQLALTWMSPRTAMLTGATALAAGTLLLGVGLAAESLAVLVVAAVVAGAGQGMSFRAGLESINAVVPVEQRGETASSFFVVLYVAISQPVVGVGLLADLTSLRTAAVVFSGLVTVLALVATVLIARSRNPSPRT